MEDVDVTPGVVPGGPYMLGGSWPLLRRLEFPDRKMAPAALQCGRGPGSGV